MEGIQSAISKVTKESNLMASFHSPPPSPYPTIPSDVLISRPPRQLVSVWTCSKLCAVCFVAGVFVGYTLKRRVRRWLSSLARRLKDD